MSRIRQFLANPYKGRALLHRLFQGLEQSCLTRRLILISQSPLGDLLTVRGSVAEYFRRRSHPTFLFQGARLSEILQNVSSEELARCVAAAEKFSSLTFSFRCRPPVTFSRAIDWSCHQADDPDWNADLHRLDWMLTLILAGHISGNSGFLKSASHWMCEWEKSNGPGTPPWMDPFEVAQRANTLCWILFAGVNHPAFPCEAVESAFRVLVLSGIWIEGTLEYKTPNNHLLIESLRLAQLGMLFPELPGAGRHYRKGMRLLEREVLRQVSRDGVHQEHSSFYQRMTAEALLEMLLLCGVNGMHLSQPVEDRIEKMFFFLEGIVRPDGTFPLTGDGFHTDTLLRYDLLCAAKKIFGRPSPGDHRGNLFTTLLMGASSGPESNERACRAPLAVWKEGGYAVFRSGKSPEENALLFDFANFGMDAAPGHGHADCLSLELTVRGRPVLIDPGAYSWRRGIHLRNGFRGTLAHNTVVVDGADQTPLYGFFGAGPFARPTVRRFQTSEHLKCVDASHDGYRRLPCPVVHRRVVLESGSDGWLVFDLLEGAGDHEIELAWHFDPRLAVHLSGDTANLLDGQRPEMLMRWRGSLLMEATVYRGSCDPFLGWVSRGSGSLDAASVLVIKGRATAPCWIASALVPGGPGLDAPDFQATSDEAGLTAFLETESSTTSVFIAWSSRRVGCFGKMQTDGAISVVREGVDPDMLGGAITQQRAREEPASGSRSSMF